MKNLFFIILISLPLSSLIAQAEFSDSDKSTFVKLYFEAKKSTPKDIGIQKVLSNHGISSSRYGNILRYKLQNENIELSSNEKDLLIAIEKLQLEYVAKERERKAKICEAHEFSYDTFVDIHHKYSIDVKFARSMKPFFDAYIESLK